MITSCLMTSVKHDIFVYLCLSCCPNKLTVMSTPLLSRDSSYPEVTI